MYAPLRKCPLRGQARCIQLRGIVRAKLPMLQPRKPQIDRDALQQRPKGLRIIEPQKLTNPKRTDHHNFIRGSFHIGKA